MQKICVIGAGYVGLVTSACFAELGNMVHCVDINAAKIETLNEGHCPIYEPGLANLIKKHLNKKLFFSINVKGAVKKSSFVFICVNTPPKPNGEADLSFVENVTREIARSMTNYKIIVSKSTVPVRTGAKVKSTMLRSIKKNIKFDVASNPEFLREGQAVHDFMNPDRIVVGVESERAKKEFEKLYKKFKCPKLFTDIQSAELIKHASNSFLACKISFINMVAAICDETGGDVNEVARGMGFDARIGKSFLNPGIGFGGSCFPKDLSAFIKVAEDASADTSLLKSIKKINEKQHLNFIQKIKKAVWNLRGKTIAILGLSFKPNTDDMRNAPSVYIIEELLKEGANIKAYDPHAMDAAKNILNEITYAKSIYECVEGSDAIVILTEWKQFAKMDFSKIKKIVQHPIIIDGRNMFDPAKMEKLGIQYLSVGRK